MKIDITGEIKPDSAVYKALVMSTHAIPWQIDWAAQRFTFIGDQIEQVLGWPANSWRTLQDWIDRIHPEDRDRVVQYCVSQCESGTDHEADYRALRPDGKYVWIRDVVHVIRDGGEVDSLVGFMFDITERKNQELELLRLQGELEALSFRDELTGVPNRRMLDASLDHEWQAASKTRQPLALILADVDHFKAYNDSLGHPAGDACLQRVATLLSESAGRPRDLVARYGGEEFLLLLPETDLESARMVAERCRLAVENARIPHPDSMTGDIVTVSLGVASIVPDAGSDASSFLNDVDGLLYEAKRNGRNCVAG